MIWVASARRQAMLPFLLLPYLISREKTNLHLTNELIQQTWTLTNSSVIALGLKYLQTELQKYLCTGKGSWDLVGFSNVPRYWSQWKADT